MLGRPGAACATGANTGLTAGEGAKVGGARHRVGARRDLDGQVGPRSRCPAKVPHAVPCQMQGGYATTLEPYSNPGLTLMDRLVPRTSQEQTPGSSASGSTIYARV